MDKARESAKALQKVDEPTVSIGGPACQEVAKFLKALPAGIPIAEKLAPIVSAGLGAHKHLLAGNERAARACNGWVAFYRGWITWLARSLSNHQRRSSPRKQRVGEKSKVRRMHPAGLGR
jgi:hypothetical protein